MTHRSPVVGRPQLAHHPGTQTRQRKLTGLGLTVPAMALLLLVVALPLGLGVYQSMTNKALTAPNSGQFIGLENYATKVIAPSFGSATWVTLLIMVLSLTLQLPIGYWLALNLSVPLRASSVFRTIITLPMMLTPVAVGLMWRFLADPDTGLIRWVVSIFGDDSRPNLLNSQFGALALIVVVNSWINIPFVTILLLAGLMGVPQDLYEAATIDGANRWQLRWHVTLPCLMPVLAVTCVLRLAGDYRMFDLVYTVTKGGPGSATRNLSMLTYQEGLVNYNTGRATAMAITMAVMAIPAYFLYRKVSRT